MDTRVIGETRACDSTVLGVGLVLADERNDYEKDRRGMQRNNQGEWCERLSSAKQHASGCEGLSALRDILDWCMDADPIWFEVARFLGRLPWRDPRVENNAAASPGRGVGPR